MGTRVMADGSESAAVLPLKAASSLKPLTELAGEPLPELGGGKRRPSLPSLQGNDPSEAENKLLPEKGSSLIAAPPSDTIKKTPGADDGDTPQEDDAIETIREPSPESKPGSKPPPLPSLPSKEIQSDAKKKGDTMEDTAGSPAETREKAAKSPRSVE